MLSSLFAHGGDGVFRGPAYDRPGMLVGVRLQNLVMKFLHELSPALLCRAVGILGGSFY